MKDITKNNLFLSVSGGECYSQTFTIKGNDITISIGNCEV